eukprot:SM000068S20575  [mRNA]  locus=s68:197067:208001:- [translate_table: standard]
MLDRILTGPLIDPLPHNCRLYLPDLYDLNPRESTTACRTAWNRHWQAAEEAASPPSVAAGQEKEAAAAAHSSWTKGRRRRETGRTPVVKSVLWQSFGHEFFVAALFKPLWLAAVVLQVYVLKALVRISEEPHKRLQWWWAMLLVFAMLATSVVQSVSQHQCFTRCQKVGMKARAAVCVAVYQKVLAMRSAALGAASSGQMLNLITNDTQKLLDAITYFHFVWHAVVELAVICACALAEAGLPALGGVFVVLMTQPIQATKDGVAQICVLLLHPQIWMAKAVGDIRRKAVQYTDARVRLVGEALAGARVVKYNGWVPAFLARMEGLRASELHWIRKAAYLRAANSTLKDTVTPLASLTTFGIYVATHHGHLKPSMAFTVLELFSIMVRIFAIAPAGLQFYGEALIACQRLQKFLQLPDGRGSCPPELARDLAAAQPGAALAASKASFAWFTSAGLATNASLQSTNAGGSRSSPPRQVELAQVVVTQKSSSSKVDFEEAAYRHQGPFLQDIDVAVPRGETVAVTGAVGSGKSSLLLAMLGEIEHRGGACFVENHIAYVPQQPWILNDTIQNNILFGSVHKPERYAAVTAACALDHDIAELPAGHETEIGERGVNLSGGQKARVSLARACYSAAPILFLDDPLAAVDVTTARHLMERILAGLLAARTVVLVTHSLRSLDFCSQTLVMAGGRLRLARTTEDLAEHGALVEEQAEVVDEADEVLPEAEHILQRMETTHSGETSNNVDDEAGGRRAQVEADELRGAAPTSVHAAGAGGRGGTELETKKQYRTTKSGWLTVAEDRVEGDVTGATYLAYIRASGGVLLFVLLMLFFVFAQVVRTLVDYWLGLWVDRKYGFSPGLYVATYAALTLVAGILSLLRALFFTFMALAAARNMHHAMALHVLRSPQLFFDQNPVGRILNRFSKDQALVDELLPSTAQVTLELLLACLGSIGIIGGLIPWFLLSLPPIGIIFKLLQRRYVRLSRELKRLDGTTRSPIYAHFSQTLSGVASIRAYGVQDRFLELFVALIDANHRAYILFVHASRWLGIRLDFCAAVCVTVTAVCVLLLRDSLAAGLAGVVLVQSLQLTGLFQYGVRQMAETENYFTSVERIHAYTELPTEAAADSPEGLVDSDWPKEGRISVRGYSMAYREDLPCVLNNLLFEVMSMEKVGILGRTGAGKSSLAAALFRMVENSSCKGKILIDGVDIARDPVLFTGTVRQNLDPFDVYSDSAICQALERVHLGSKIESEGGLDSVVSENGENFSVGQRQLLCLARALLRKSKVIVMDEATAAVDGETDILIQATMRDVFRSCTVITIAHRIDTVIDCNRVLILAKGGRIAEFDSPANLLHEAAGTSLPSLLALRRTKAGLFVLQAETDCHDCPMGLMSLSFTLKEEPFWMFLYATGSSVFASMVAQTGPAVSKRLREAAKAAERERAQQEQVLLVQGWGNGSVLLHEGGSLCNNVCALRLLSSLTLVGSGELASNGGHQAGRAAILRDGVGRLTLEATPPPVLRRSFSLRLDSTESRGPTP